MTQEQTMDKCIKCLALELPQPVWEDVNKNYQAYKAARDAEIERLRKALEKISMQHTCQEMISNDMDDTGDIEYAYDRIISDARAALTKKQ